MPNWVFNTLTVIGGEEEVARFKKQASQPYESFHMKTIQAEDGTWSYVPAVSTVEGELLFWNFVKPDNLEEYYEDTNWYDWNIDNWGCKWETRGTLDPETPQELTYRFDTAWSPPEDWFRKAVQQFPELSFKLFYEEEQGWGGQMLADDGAVHFEDSWDIPETHAERMSHYEYCYCEEMNDSDAEYMHEDCPRRLELENANLSTVS